MSKTYILAGWLIDGSGGPIHYLYSHGVRAVCDGGDRGGFALRYRSKKEMHKRIGLRVSGRAWHKKGRYGSLIEVETPKKLKI